MLEEALSIKGADASPQYVQQQAAAIKKLFSDKAISIIYNNSRGIPREINNICDLCLLIGLSRKSTIIGEEIANEVIRDIKPESMLDDNLVGEKQNG